MSNKAQELELRNILEGLEEFATFMSYQSDFEGLRILSVETTQQASAREQREVHGAKVIPISTARASKTPARATISKALRFQDRSYH